MGSNSKWLRGIGLSSLEKLGPFNIFQAENPETLSAQLTNHSENLRLFYSNNEAKEFNIKIALKRKPLMNIPCRETADKRWKYTIVL